MKLHPVVNVHKYLHFWVHSEKCFFGRAWVGQQNTKKFMFTFHQVIFFFESVHCIRLFILSSLVPVTHQVRVSYPLDGTWLIVFWLFFFYVKAPSGWLVGLDTWFLIRIRLVHIVLETAQILFWNRPRYRVLLLRVWKQRWKIVASTLFRRFFTSTGRFSMALRRS